MANFIEKIFGSIFGNKNDRERKALQPLIDQINAEYAGVNWYRHHLNELKTVSAAQTKMAEEELWTNKNLKKLH